MTNMFRIEQLRGLEILDSRGRPTVQATCRLASGFAGTASVRHEPELRRPES